MNLKKKMKRYKNYLSPVWLVSIAVLMGSCAHQKTIAQAPGQQDSRPVAFPGAEGFGKYTTGGRGGKVYIVSNLADDGAGSLREAASSKGPRTIVFSVSGTIRLKSLLQLKSNTTVAGQTAPGDGICIADYPVSISGDNIIIRYLRVRLGDRYENTGMVDGAGSDDAMGGGGRKNIIVDHCSVSWSNDEVLSIYNGDSTTLQWNLISEPLNYSYHFEKGDTKFENHGYGGIWGGMHMSAHHNLFAHCVSRMPRFNGTRGAHIPEEYVDYRNNVLYDWEHNNAYGGEGGTYSLVNNYYKPGPATSKTVIARIVNPYAPYGKYFVAGNYMEGSADVTKDNSLGVHLEGNKGTTEADKKSVIVLTDFNAVSIPVQSAKDAYADVLAKVGAIFPARDTLDQRIVNDVKNGTGGIIDVQGGYPHGTAFEQTVNAWPALRSAPALVDSDSDGMPDEWEKKNGLDPSKADANGNKLHAFYTNIEVYLNELVK
jgi:pectate lyase